LSYKILISFINTNKIIFKSLVIWIGAGLMKILRGYLEERQMKIQEIQSWPSGARQVGDEKF
jgi:hypothetical protein